MGMQWGRTEWQEGRPEDEELEMEDPRNGEIKDMEGNIWEGKQDGGEKNSIVEIALIFHRPPMLKF